MHIAQGRAGYKEAQPCIEGIELNNLCLELGAYELVFNEILSLIDF